jgi:hypothetical protein
MRASGGDVRRSRRRVIIAAVAGGFVATIVLLIVVRYVTFDPKRFVGDLQDRLSPQQPATVNTLANGSASSAAPSAAERARQFELTIGALRRRYHASAGPCYRYLTKEDGPVAPEKADEVADALLAANLTGRLDALMPASARWARDADDATHAAGPDVEIVDYFAGEAGLWTRLGVAMRRGAILGAVKTFVEPPPPPVRSDPLSAEEQARAKPLWERYGHLQLVQGAMQIAVRMHVVDLRASHLRLLEPGMSQSAARALLGPAEEDGRQWRYPQFGTEVTFDAEGRVSGIASALAFGDRVIVDGAEQRQLDEASLSRVMGKPLRVAESEAGEAVLVYGAGPHAMILVIPQQLTRVELWRKDLVLSGAR